VQTVVIVEHDTMLGALYELELSEEGYAVIVAKTAAQALQLIELQSVDIIITDISGRDQEAATAENRLIRGVYVPVIINTGYTSRTVRGFLSTRVGHVLKSSNLAKLKAKIKIMLAGGAHSRAEKTGAYTPADGPVPESAGPPCNSFFLPAEHCRPEYCHG
jgi:DNA-binding response OmpR family regulator